MKKVAELQNFCSNPRTNWTAILDVVHERRFFVAGDTIESHTDRMYLKITERCKRRLWRTEKCPSKSSSNMNGKASREEA